MYSGIIKHSKQNNFELLVYIFILKKNRLELNNKN
jgi:hypothetical protein